MRNPHPSALAHAGIERYDYPVNRLTQRLAALALTLGLAAPLRVHAYTPTSSYETRKIQGFTVLFAPEVMSRPERAQAMAVFLDEKLGEAARLLPSKAWTALQKIRFWVEWEQTTAGSTYHPSRRWLTEHGYNPDKEKNIELSNLAHVLAWGRSDQPMLVVHELAHAYHDTVLGFDEKKIIAAYQHALRVGLYARVPYVHGGKKRAYALNNEHEFFAELTEAYFGLNDYFPYTRTDLRSYDPAGYALMESVWGRDDAPARLKK